MRNRRLKCLLLASMIALGLLSPAGVRAQVTAPNQWYSFTARVQGDSMPYENIGANGVCRVLTTATNNDATIYTTGSLATTASNPIALDAQGTVTFYMPTGTTTVDLVCNVQSGAYLGALVHITGLTRNSVKVGLATRGFGLKAAMLSFTSTGAGQTFNFPSGAVVKDIVVQTVTAVASSSLTVYPNQTGAYSYGWLSSPGCSTATAIFTYCAPTAPTVAAVFPPHPSNSYALTVNTQGHATAGYVWVFYEESANHF